MSIQFYRDIFVFEKWEDWILIWYFCSNSNVENSLVNTRYYKGTAVLGYGKDNVRIRQAYKLLLEYWLKQKYTVSGTSWIQNIIN